VVVADNGIAYVWDIATAQIIHQLIGHTTVIYNAKSSPDGRYIATVRRDHTAGIWDLNTGEEVRRFQGHTDDLFALAFSPDGKNLVTGGKGRTAPIWTTDYHDLVKSLCPRLYRDLTRVERLLYGIDSSQTCNREGGNEPAYRPLETLCNQHSARM
jgi:WD40 repeat protein